MQKNFFLLVTFLFLSQSLFSQIAGDDCNSAPFISIGNVSSFGQNSYTASGATPVPTCPLSSGFDAWVKVNIPSSGNLGLHTSNYGLIYDYSIAVYSGTCGNLSLIDCDEDAGERNNPFIFLQNRTPNETIYIRIWSFNANPANGSISDFRFNITAVDPTLPSNDNCSTPKALNVGTNSQTPRIVESITFATNSGLLPVPSCGDFGLGKDLWYSVNVPASGNVIISTKDDIFSSLNDPVASNVNLAAYSGSCGVLVEEGCGSLNELAGSTLILENQTPNSTLLIRAWEEGTDEIGNFNIFAYDFTPPSNDECSQAKFITTNATCTNANSFVDSNLEGATISALALPCNNTNAIGADVWYKTVVPASGNLAIEMFNIMNYAAYTYDCNTPSLLGFKCQDRVLTLENLIPNDTVLIRAWPSVGTLDNLKICASDPPIPNNNNCSAPTPLNVGAGLSCNLLRENLRYSTPSSLASDSCNPGGKDLWYSFVVPASGSVYLQRSDSNHFGITDDAFAASFYTKSDCNFLVPILCNGALPYPFVPLSGSYNSSYVELLNLTPTDTLLLRLTKYNDFYSPFGHTGFAEDQELSICLSEQISGTFPVTLNNFHGIEQPTSNKLLWETRSEENSKEFIIERSLDNQEWLPIGDIQAQGNSSTKNSYSYIDEKPPLNSFYRLKMIDLDNSFEYSDIVQLKRTQNSKTISIFPNPVKNQFVIEFANINEINSVKLYNVLGALLKEIDFASNTTVDMSNLPNGIYLVQTTTAYGVEYSKIIKK